MKNNGPIMFTANNAIIQIDHGNGIPNRHLLKLIKVFSMALPTRVSRPERGALPASERQVRLHCK